MHTAQYFGTEEDRNVPPRLDADGRQVRAILMYSGGLDSTLAAIILRRQGIDVVAVNMFTGFCLTDHKKKMGHRRKDGSLYEHEAVAGAAQLEIPVEMVDVREGYLQVITNPQHGYGANMNPCKDCRIHMLGHAKELLEDYDAHFIATGEVIGQRPMSQLRRAMQLIESRSGLQRMIVRPLCQPLLWETIPEEQGWVDTCRLMRMNGRSRKPQEALAKEVGLVEWPQPAGGCCSLTDVNYSVRMRDLLDHMDPAELDYTHVTVLKVGRHFRLPHGAKLIVGRNSDENDFLLGYGHLGLFVEARDATGPIALVMVEPDHPDFELALQIVGRYSKIPAGDSAVFSVRRYDRDLVERTAAALEHGGEVGWKLV